MTNKKIKQYINPSYLLITLFFAINLLTLMRFPTIHSDELWLRGIADEMRLRNSFSVTEPFFDLYPRVIHPFRWLYNLILIGYFNIFTSSAFTMRLVSLTFGTITLFVFDKIISKRFNKTFYRIFGTLVLAIDVQFIYANHMGRQETIILFLLLSGFLLTLSDNRKQIPYMLSALVLIGMGIHPNSFILGVVFSAILAYKVITSDIPRSVIFQFWGTTCIGVILYAIIGHGMNPTFISGYLDYGATLGVDAPLMNRFEGFYWYWIKLFKQIGGTYDLMDIRVTLVLMGLLVIYWTIMLFKKNIFKTLRHDASFYALFATIGIVLSLFIIGRYNQTAVIFLVPFALLMMLEVIFHFDSQSRRSFSKVAILLMLIVWCTNLYSNLEMYDRNRFYSTSYEGMLEKLNASVPENARVLANLNTIEAFESSNFYDIRNLAYLDSNRMTFEDYITERGIQYIILHEEMDYIARNSARWGFLYGNIEYYDAMMTFINKKTRLVGSFENPIYAMRISRYSGTYPWQTFIYEVLD